MGDVVDVSDVFEPLSICNDLSTVGKGKAAINISGEEDVQRSYSFLTPNGGNFGKQLWLRMFVSEFH
ncbi:hypothetical protein R6Q59_025265 [Mikania micrantha]